MTGISEIIFGLVFFFYLINIFMFYYFTIEKIRMIELIILAKNARKRQHLESVKSSTKKDIILCFFWPLIFLREITNGLKKKK